MKRTEVITVQWKTVPYIYNTTCKEMFPNIDAAMIYVQPTRLNPMEPASATMRSPTPWTRSGRLQSCDISQSQLTGLQRARAVPSPQGKFCRQPPIMAHTHTHTHTALPVDRLTPSIVFSWSYNLRRSRMPWCGVCFVAARAFGSPPTTKYRLRRRKNITTSSGFSSR